MNIRSILALAPKRSAPVYSGTKAGLRTFTRGLRDHLSDVPQIQVVEVIPPLVDTAMTEGRGKDKMSPAEVAEAVVRGLEAGSDEIWVGKTRAVPRIARWMPGLLARILRKA